MLLLLLLLLLLTHPPAWLPRQKIGVKELTKPIFEVERTGWGGKKTT